MQRWTVSDQYGHEIYMTAERWTHILSKHYELLGHLDDVLETIRKGKRRQDRRDPQRYRYRRICLTLPRGNNHISVVVVFSFQENANGILLPNNFVSTAWGERIL